MDAFVGVKIAINSVASLTFDETIAVSQGAIKSSANAVNLSYNTINIAKNYASTKTAFIHILK